MASSKLRRSSFGQPNGNNPKLTIEKRKKKKKTILKESIGLTSWDSLVDFFINEGADKFIKELKKLTGRNYAVCYQSALEFVKPKLARKEITGKDGKDLIPPTITQIEIIKTQK